MWSQTVKVLNPYEAIAKSSKEPNKKEKKK